MIGLDKNQGADVNFYLLGIFVIRVVVAIVGNYLLSTWVEGVLYTTLNSLKIVKDIMEVWATL